MRLIENNYVMTVMPSKQQPWVWCVINAILHTVLAIVLIRLSWEMAIVVSLLIVSYLVLTFVTFAVKHFTYQLIINECGQLQYKYLVKLNGELLPKSFTTNWFIWLCVEMSTGEFSHQKTISMVIWRDSLDDKSFRRLARIIRLKRQMI